MIYLYFCHSCLSFIHSDHGKKNLPTLDKDSRFDSNVSLMTWLDQCVSLLHVCWNKDQLH